MNEQDFDLRETVSNNRVVGLWRITRGFRLVYLLAVVALAIATLARTAIFYLLRYFVDDVLPMADTGLIVLWMALGFIVLALVQGGFTFISGRWAARTAEGISLRLRNFLYDHIQRLTFTYHDQTQTGELLQRATSDVDAMRLFFSEQAIGAGRILLMLFVNWAGIYLLSPYLAWMSVIVIPIIIVASLYFFTKVGKVFEAFQEQEAVLSNRLQENLSGVRVVKAFARQDYEIKRFDVENDKKFRTGVRFAYMHGTFWPITDILCSVQMIFGFWLAGRLAIAGEITVGTYMAYAGMLVLIIWPISNLGRLITDMSTAVVSYGRMSEVMRQEREPLAEGVLHPEHDLRGDIVFDNVSFAYDGLPDRDLDDKTTAGKHSVGVMAEIAKQGKAYKLGETVLHNISFRARPGQTIALLGATGSGKTTLTNLLPRFYDYTAGQIRLDGRELRDYTRDYLRGQIGIVMQEPFLFSRTIRENITFGVGREVTEEELFAAARAAAVHEVILSFPKGYNTLVGERGVTLSGGQKQRITLARTLLKNPRILILDDATSSVDTHTESEIRGALRRMADKRTTFVIAHRVQSVMTADLILVLAHGRVVQQGTHAELLADAKGIYRQVYDLQARIEDELVSESADHPVSELASELVSVPAD